MSPDPVRQPLRPRRFRVCQVRRAQHGHENLRQAHLAGRRIDNRDTLARVVDERLVPSHMGLPHGWRQTTLEAAIQLAEPTVAIPFQVNRLIFLPQDHQVHPRPLHFLHQRCPVRLGVAAHAPLEAGRREQPLLQHLIRHVRRQWPDKIRRRYPCKVALYRAAPDAQLARNHACARMGFEMQLQNLSYPPHGQSLRRHSIHSIGCDGALDAR